MNIAKNTVVNLSYCLRDAGGEELDRTDASEPLSYLHGYGQLIPGLEKELEGMSVGGTKKVTVPPREGYGDILPNLKMQVPRGQFPPDARVEPGIRFMADVGDGREHMFLVESVEGEMVCINGNHPLAGQTLFFDVEVVGVRAATDAEMEHGHSHDGGHAH